MVIYNTSGQLDSQQEIFVKLNTNFAYLKILKWELVEISVIHINNIYDYMVIV